MSSFLILSFGLLVSSSSSFFFSLLLPQLMRFLPDKSSMISCGWKASSGFIHWATKRRQQKHEMKQKLASESRSYQPFHRESFYVTGTPTSFSFFLLLYWLLDVSLSSSWLSNPRLFHLFGRVGSKSHTKEDAIRRQRKKKNESMIWYKRRRNKRLTPWFTRDLSF